MNIFGSSSKFAKALYSLAVFLAGSLIGPPIGEFGKTIFAQYQKIGNAPLVAICAPLQDARTVVRKRSKIVGDHLMGYPNPTTVAFTSDKGDFKNLRILAYPLTSDRKKPVLYQARVVSSDLLSSEKMEARVDESAIRVEVPALRSGSTIFIEALFGEPIHFLVEVSADDYSANFIAVPGCSNAPKSIKTLPTKDIFNYRLATCGAKKSEPCDIPGFTAEFTVDADGIQPEFEEFIISNNQRLFRDPSSGPVNAVKK